MKKLFTTLVALSTIGIAAHAQKNVDLAFESVLPVTDGTYPNVAVESDFDFKFKVINNGTDAVTATDTIAVWFLGTMFRTSDNQLSWNVSRFSGLDIPAGGSVEITETMTKGGGYYTETGDTIIYWFFDNTLFQFSGYPTADDVDVSYVLEGYGWSADGMLFTDADILDHSDPDNSISGDNQLIIRRVTFGEPSSIFDINGLDKQLITVYPNPTNSDINFEYNFTSSTNANANIYDITGKLVMSKDFGSQYAGLNTFRISTSELPAGNYTLELVTNENRGVSKFTVTK